jgi:predicted PolB exonuclease-like 3'-5' exonuclease
MGLPRKNVGANGSGVANFYAQGRIKEISDDRETDVINTYLVWLR